MEPMRVTIWELPNCVQCQQTKRMMDKLGITYTVRALNRSPKAIERFKELGLIAAPIVETDDRRWSGFRLGKIQSLATHLKHERAKGINVPEQPITQVADEVSEEAA
jgi:glutaredoxin-like protein NrdH